MRRCQLLIISLVLALFTTANAQSHAPADVHVKLSVADNKTVYRMGEPIKLVLEFTADREGYNAETLPDRGEQPVLDTLIISPDQGFTNWFDEMTDNYHYPRDVISNTKLSSSPQRIDIVLNDTLRFDSPGRYTISIKTRRVSRRLDESRRSEKLSLSTESLTFEVQPMSEADEAKEVKRLSDLLDAARDYQTREEVSQQLSYLSGDPSTREKVRRSLTPDERPGSSSGNLWAGLFIARNRALALKLLESGMRDPNVPLTTQILHVATRLKVLLTHGVREQGSGPFDPSQDPRSIEIRDAYVVELAAGLGKRTGNSQTTTAMTILSSLPKDTQAASAGLREVRRILVQQFETLNPYSQDSLLQQHWDLVRDPALIPSLKKMAGSTDARSIFVRHAALNRLLEMAPDEARSVVIAEVRDPNSSIDPKILSALKDEALPEVDGYLLQQIRMFATSPHSLNLKYKIALLVRFGTERIYSEAMDFYQTTGVTLPAETRAGLLAYLAKLNEREGIPLIEQAVSELKAGEEPAVLKYLTTFYYSEAIGAVVKKLLETDDVRAASEAAYLIGLHGVAGDEQVLEARLKRWREQWRDRVLEADAQQQGQIERELIYALINGKAWKLPAERVRELQTSCITQLCKQSNPVRN
jgi:hypothetical protein